MARKANKEVAETKAAAEVTPEVEKTEEQISEVEQETPSVEEQEVAETKAAAEVTPEVEKLMQLYPNLEGMWITPEGFVHPEGVPERYRKNAKFYKNKYYKQ